MPFISDAQLARVNTSIESANKKAQIAKMRVEEKAGEIKDIVEMVSAGAAMGAARGYYESKMGKPFALMGKVDIELLTGLGLIGLGMADVLGEYDNDALMLGGGCLAHYAGEISRKSVKEGSFQTVGALGSGDMLDQMLQGTL